MVTRQTPVAALAFFVLLAAPNYSAAEFRTIDGSGNNLTNPAWAQAEQPLVRHRDAMLASPTASQYDLLAPTYSDPLGVDRPRGLTEDLGPSGVAASSLPSPRTISNVVVKQAAMKHNPLGASDWLWQWGQFLDHDYALEEPTPTSQPFMIPVEDPADPLYSPTFPFIPFRRNDPAPGTGAGTGTPREQVNALTGYIDASNVYGSDAERAQFLRTGTGGMLKTTVGTNGETLLPYNRAVNPFPNANPPVTPGAPTPNPEELFLAGDVRANEQIGLTATHTLFLREHNRMAGELGARSDLAALVSNAGYDSGDPDQVDEYLYQTSRKAVGAMVQAITYNEFLPMLIGQNALPAYSGYDPTANATLSNEFANAAYRVGHTLLSPTIKMAGVDGGIVGEVALRDAFFDPTFAPQHGVDTLLKGLGMGTAQDVDALVIDEVRSFLFAEANGGLDLAAVNIQRGRDHGLPTYNDMREGLGLERRTSFAEITDDPGIADKLASVYDSVDDVDLWLGAVAEDRLDEGLVGELLNAIFVDQFSRLRDGDRFFYQNPDTNADILALYPGIGDTTLSHVIMRNSNIQWMQSNAFVAVPEPAVIAMLFALGALGCARQPKRH